MVVLPRRLPPLLVIFLAGTLISASNPPNAAAGTNSWTTNGPNPNVQSLVADPAGKSSVYAGAYGPILFDLKDGTWTEVADGTGSPSPNLDAIAVAPSNPSTIYVGVSSSLEGLHFPPGGLYRSADGGRSWQFFQVHATDPVSAIAVDPSDENVVYAIANYCFCAGPRCFPNGGCLGSLYKSVDAGAKWTLLNLPLSVDDVVTDPF